MAWLNDLEYEIEADDTVFYVHIPKTGGSTVRQYLDTQFNPATTCPAKDIYVFRDLDLDGRQYRWIRGHYFYYQIQQLFAPPQVYLITLRDPVERLLSAYWYARTLKIHPAYEIANQHGLAAYLELEGTDGFGYTLTNTHVKMLTVGHITHTVDQDDLALAQNRVADFQWIGILEKMNESFALLAYTFGWQPIPLVEKRNITHKRKSQADYDDDLLDDIRQRNKLDYAFYTSTLDLFNARYEAMGQDLLTRYGTAQHAHQKHPLNDDTIYALLQKHYAERMRQRAKSTAYQVDIQDNKYFKEGWHLAEVGKNGQVHRWTNGEKRAVMHLPLATDQLLTLSLRVQGVLKSEILDSVTCWVNGQAIPLTCHRKNRFQAVFSAILPQSVLETQSYTHLELRVSQTCTPQDIDSASEDKRQLGLQIDSIDINPA